MRISDWSSDVCSSDLLVRRHHGGEGPRAAGQFQRLPRRQDQRGAARRNPPRQEQRRPGWDWRAADDRRAAGDRQCDRGRDRSEEHTSELQSLIRISYAVFCLKKKMNEPYPYQTQVKGIASMSTQLTHHLVI